MPTPLRVLTLDCECLPGHWIGGDYVSKILTAVAWAWDDGAVEVLTHYDEPPTELAAALAAEMETADIVTGHYIRGFDLPLVNGNLLAGGLYSLGPILASDTKLDLLKSHGRSLSQKNLSAQLGVAAPKIDVSLPDWEGFNTRQPGYRDKGVERVVGDVEQHREMRARLVALEWLGKPRVWSPTPKGQSRYQA